MLIPPKPWFVNRGYHILYMYWTKLSLFTIRFSLGTQEQYRAGTRTCAYQISPLQVKPLTYLSLQDCLTRVFAETPVLFIPPCHGRCFFFRLSSNAFCRSKNNNKNKKGRSLGGGSKYINYVLFNHINHISISESFSRHQGAESYPKGSWYKESHSYPEICGISRLVTFLQFHHAMLVLSTYINDYTQ